MRAPSVTGTLYLVATPIGNLEDLSLRALRVLREAGLVACEDTRQTRKLLNHYAISTRVVSYHQHNERARAAELVAHLSAGRDVALVCDAGTPLVSDPGAHLVAACLAAGIRVTPVPGPTAFVAALAASGLAGGEFLFAGFLPARRGERRRALARLAGEPRTLIFYEAPHRIAATLADAREALGDRRAALARELTKVHEEFLRGTLSELLERVRASPPRGEITLVIAAAEPPAGASTAAAAPSLAARVSALVREAGLDRKAALKQAAREMGIPRREAYRLLLGAQRNS